MRARRLLIGTGPLALCALAACGGKAPSPAVAKNPPAPAASGTPAAKGAPRPGEPFAMVTPSRLLPELVGQRGVIAAEDGYRRVLVDRMRILARDDGSIERADELFPLGSVSTVKLPSRLGGGYLFHVNGGGGTMIWRAAGWLDKLKPLTQVGATVHEIVPGFDRLYVRLSSGHRLLALDAETGAPMGTGPLPPSSAYGTMAIADGWRGVVETDLRGPLATFDAGMTWRPVGLAERPLGVTLVGGNPAVNVPSGRYVIDARGAVTLRADTARDPSLTRDEPEAVRPPGPLGRRPLRAAVEDGWPDGPDSAVVARGGALARISLRDGSVIAMAESAYPERQSTCHGVRVGNAEPRGRSGIGFVCGEREGPTTIYEFVPPLEMKPLMRFSKPRLVIPSGNGALVIRGGCDDGDALASDARPYCVRSPSGTLRPVLMKGDVGVEHVIGLGDGRTVVLVPPRGGSAGTLTIIPERGAPTNAALRLPAEPKSVVRELKRGMWLEGFEERSPGVIGGWIESGGPLLGIEIGLDGKVKAGELRDDAGGAVIGGRFAVSVMDGGRAAETTDGGMTWSAFDLPERDEEARALPTRACSPVGCALGGWVRVGWGEPRAKDDLKQADPPPSPNSPLRTSTTLTFACDVGASATPPQADKPKAAPPPSPRARGGPAAPGRPGRETPNGWASFRNTPPPALGEGEYGIDNGPTYDTVQLRAYAWGKKGADWTRTGRWLVRFDDRFDPTGGVRGSALTASPWPDEAAAFDGVGSGSYGSVSWSGFLDPSGRALLASACRSSTCAIYAVGDGQPVLPVRDASGRAGVYARTYASGAVRLGDTWFFLTQGSSYDAVALHRVDLGVARAIGSYFRPSQRYGSGLESPRLVRRALGGGLGILVAGAPDPGEKSGTWYVIPVDSESGKLGEAVPLVRRDLSGLKLDRCAPEQDGWLFDASLDTTPIIELTNGRGTIENVELRLRVDPNSACIDALASRISGTFASELPKPPKAAPPPAHGKPVPPPKPPPPPPFVARPVHHAPGEEPSLPMAATERPTGKRWTLMCRVKPKK